MERHFTLPVVLSAAVHAALLLSPAPEKTSIELVPTPPDVLPPVLVPLTFEDPPPPPFEASDEAGGAASPDTTPRSVEPPALPDGGPTQRPGLAPVTVTIDRTSPPALALPGTPGATGLGEGLGPRSFGIGDLDAPPRARLQPAPTFPYEARRNGIEGEVVVEFGVDESGHVLEPRVVQATDRVFEEPALRAVHRWRFEPGRRNGQTVRFRMQVAVRFSLEQ